MSAAAEPSALSWGLGVGGARLAVLCSPCRCGRRADSAPVQCRLVCLRALSFSFCFI